MVKAPPPPGPVDDSIMDGYQNAAYRWGSPEHLTWTIATHHYENFHVGSLFLPRKYRQDIFNVYSWCRFSDDLGDEATGDRHALIREWREDLILMYQGEPQHPIHLALQKTIRAKGIPKDLFDRLLVAFADDIGQVRMADWAALRDYCRLSADPVGELFLHVFGGWSESNRDLSDEVCTGLQLANHLQDLGRDLDQDRIYLPQDEMAEAGVKEEDLFAHSESYELQALMHRQVSRAQGHFDRGRPLIDEVPRDLRRVMRLFVYGGERVLERIRSQDYQVLRARPKLGRMDKLGILIKALW